MPLDKQLPQPKRYFPLAHGRYDVAAGLSPLGADPVFEIDQDYFNYISEKHRSRSEDLDKYFPMSHELDEPTRLKVTRFLYNKLAQEHPQHFSLEQTVSGYNFTSKLLEEKITFDNQFQITGHVQKLKVPHHNAKYRCALDAFACQVQEDFSIWKRDLSEPSKEWLAMIHLCFPNHWAAEDKIGKTFNNVHAPVAGFGRLAKASDTLVDSMVARGPFYRFAWGVATDTILNHHPHSPYGPGRAFNLQKPELYLRIERQTLTPFPDVGASLFTIRSYFLDCTQLRIDDGEVNALISAIDSMSPESLVYKGLAQSKDDVIAWLRTL